MLLDKINIIINRTKIISTATILSASLFSISGCNYITGGADNSEPPMSLTKIEAERNITNLWTTKVGVGDGGQYLKLKPLVLDNRIITIDSNGLLQATNTSNGSLLWKKNLNSKITQGVAGNDSQIYVSNSHGLLTVLSTKDGSKLWEKPLSKNILNNPAYDQHNIYLQATDGSFYALNKNNGTVKWEYKMPVPDLTLYSTSSPLVWKDTVITGFANGKLVSFNTKNGTPNWEYQIAYPAGQSSIQRMVDVNASPLIVNGFLYAVSYQGKIVSLDLITGTTQWERELSSISDMSFNGKYLYVSDTEGTVWALNRTNGRVLWKQANLHMRKLSGTNVAGNTILVGDYDGYIHGLSEEHGGFIARTKLASSGIRVAPIVKNGIIYVLDNSGQLAAYKLESTNSAKPSATA